MASLLVVCTLIVGGLRIWLEHSPSVSQDIVARVEAVTGLRLRFDKLEATLGWYGPELVFRQARILNKDNGATVVTARAGRVGFDVWRALSTGRLASARVLLDGAIVHLLVLPTGIELVGEEALKRGEKDSTPLTIQNLPVGRARLDDGVIVVEDRRSARTGFSIDHVSVDLDREPHELKFAVLVKLPRTLGARLEVKGTIEGTGEADSPLAWTATADGRALRFEGFSDLLKDVVRLPQAGSGDVHLGLAGAGLVLTHADTTLALQGLKLPPLLDGRAPVASALSGTFSLDRPGAAAMTAGVWRVRARDVAMGSGAQRWAHGQLDAEWVIGADGIERAKVKVPDLPLGVLAPFGALAPQLSVRSALASLAPAGHLHAVDVTAERSNGAWAIDGGMSFKALAIGAYDKIPGAGQVDGEFSAHGDHGTLTIRARPFTLHLAQWLRGPVTADSIAATVDWRHAADGWHLASDNVTATTPDAHGGGLFRLWLPAQNEPPHLVLDMDIRDVDVRGVAKYLPTLRFPIDATTWLDNALLAGRVPQARLQFVGPTEGFPFRDHQGLFLVQGSYTGVRLHYGTGWADVEDVAGDLEFRNQGFSAVARSGRIGGLTIGPSRAGIEDFRDTDVVVSGTASGDLHKALRLVQGSPLAKSLGSYFAAIDGRGAVHGNVDLLLPLRHFGDRRIVVDAHVDHGAARLPGLDDEVSEINGGFRLRNLDIDVPGLSATVFGGPVTVRGESVVPKANAPGLHTLALHVQGHALATRLQPQLGITVGTWLAGATDWKAEVRVPRVEWQRVLPPKPPELTLWEQHQLQAGHPLPHNPDERPPLPHTEPESKLLPVSVRVESSLTGLELRFPAPLAKDASDSRRLKLEVSIDPGVRAGDPAPPRSLAPSEEPREQHLGVQLAFGADSFSGEWLPKAAGAEDGADGHAATALSLYRATAHFGAGTPRLRDAPGLWLEGRLPRYDLSAWLRLQTSDKPPGKPLNTWLRGGDLTIDHFAILGFELRDVRGSLAAGADAWNINGTGPDAAGSVVVPYDLKGARPVELNLDRLTLNERTPLVPGAATVPRDPPSTLPSITAHVGNLEFMKRRLGDLTAVLTRIDGGVRLDRADIKASSFTAHATGRWTGEGAAELCELDATAHSTDLHDTLAALAFEPNMNAQSADARGQLRWHDGLDDTILERLQGHTHVQVKDGQILNVQPGAGRVFGLLSVANLPRRLALDFHDLTDKGFAFDSIQGDFDFRDGNAFTNNVVIKGPAADIGLVGRTGFKAQDYDQIAVVTGHFSDCLLYTSPSPRDGLLSRMPSSA